MGAFVSVVATATVTGASVQDFSFSQFSADYYLSKDDEGRSTMRVVERLTAEFPTYQQNKGIIRAIPMMYDGHTVSLKFDDQSLSRNGDPEPVYERQVRSGNLEISTGTDDYVLGQQTYQFTYTLRDVTKTFQNHQEIFWDTNGTEWRQSFDVVIARLHLDPDLTSAFSGETTCYQGSYGSREQCQQDIETSNESTVITFRSTRSLAAGENLSFVAGFAPETFAPYTASLSDFIGLASRIAVGILALGVIAWTVIFKLTRAKNAKGRGVIVPQYLPPKDIALLSVSQLYGSRSQKPIAAQIVDLAVRHNLQIIEFEKSQFFGKTKAYKVKLVSIDGLHQDEKAFLQILFKDLTIGAEYEIGNSADSTRIGMAIASFNQKQRSEMIARGYRRTVPGQYLPIVSSVGVAVVTVLVNIFVYDAYSSEFLTVITFIVGFAPLTVSIFLLAGAAPLTEKGAEIRDYVKGLEMYIKVAEAERLKLLQSVEGSMRQEIGDVNDPKQLVKLYERVLPYAILVGLEKSWGKVLEQYYEPSSSPSWYAGTSAFSAAAFSSSISSFAVATNSSSSGFSGSGGSGGGGGGGGGGGR